jgi:hypothetical protein
MKSISRDVARPRRSHLDPVGRLEVCEPAGPGTVAVMEIGLVGILLVILLIVAIIYFARRA